MRVHVADPSAQVSPGAIIGNGTQIWQHCIVLEGARIGENCKLSHNVFVEGGAVLGDRVVVKDNVCLYDMVEIGDDVFVGPNVVFTNVLTPRASVSRKDEFLPTVIGPGATIGANATLVCGHRIGEFAMIGAGAVVTGDVLPFALMAGNPARRIGWVSKVGEKLGLDLQCPRTGETYVQRDGRLVPSG